MGIFVCGVFTSLIGMVYFYYGKKEANFYYLIAGGLLMFYPYFVGNLIAAVIIGVLLTIAPFIMNAYM